MPTGIQLTLRGFALDKDGRRVVRDSRRLNVSARLRAKGRRWGRSITGRAEAPHH